MADILRKLALSLLTSQLANPATRQQMHDYVNAQINTFIDREAAALDVSNPFANGLATALKSPETKAALDLAADAEFDALLALLLARVTAA